MSEDPILAVSHLAVHFRKPGGNPFRPKPPFVAVDGISFSIGRGEVLGLVGESGSGKSTTARAVMGLERPVSGTVAVLGRDIFAMPFEELRKLRPRFQMVFQDPYGSLDPRHTVGRIVAEPLHGTPYKLAREAAAQSLETVGLRPTDVSKFPHQFSGGQRQRIAIARALVARPDLMVADEPVSALDVSVQAQVLNLIKDLQRALRMSVLFVGHDLSVVRYMCARICVMFRGRIVEAGDTEAVLRQPAHPYTRELIDAMPRLGVRRRGRPPTRPAPAALPASEQGCAYLARCPLAEVRCAQEAPALRAFAAGREAACHRASISS